MRIFIFICFTTISFSCHKSDLPLETIDNTSDILFISQRIPNTADWQMFIRKGDGTGEIKLTNKIVTCAPPVPSNDGQWIAFIAYENSSSNLYVTDKSGQNLKLISTSNISCSCPSWSPDNSKIAFVKEEKDNTPTISYSDDIFVVNSDGTNEKLLVKDAYTATPCWNNNGTKILFTALANRFFSIHEINIDGSGEKLLSPQNIQLAVPTLSPDGSKIAAVSPNYEGSQIFVMDYSGPNVKQLTFTASPTHDPGWARDANGDPVWSPDSKKIAYVSWESGNPDIFIINADGSGNTRITDSPHRDEDPTWTPDGKYVIFSSGKNYLQSNEDLYISTLTGKVQNQLTNWIADDVCPVILK